jgi:endonuclease III
MVTKKDLAETEGRREMIRQLSGFEREEAEYQAEVLVIYERRIGELEQRMAEQSKGDADIGRLRGIPGVGPKIAYAFTAYVGVE